MNPKTYEDFLTQRQAIIESDKWTDRVEQAGIFYEMGEPLTDEILATREYLRRKSLGLMDLSGKVKNRWESHA